jgi:hypothetical protein
VASGFGRVRVRRRTSTDALGERLGLNHSVSTGDPVFDGRVYLESYASDEQIRGVLGAGAVRSSVLRLLDMGLTTVTIEAVGPAVVVEGPSPSLGMYQRFPAVAHELEALADALPAIEPARSARGFTRVDIAPALAALLGLTAVITGTQMAFANPAIESTPWLAGAGAGLAAWVVAVVVLWLAVRRTWHGLRTFTVFVPALFFTLLCLGPGAAHLLNRELDDSKVVVHDTVVARTWVVQVKNGTSNHTSVRSWRADMAEIELPGSATRASQRQGDKFRVGTRAGALGWEWIVWARPR